MHINIENIKTVEELNNDLMALKLKIALQECQQDEYQRIMMKHGENPEIKKRLENCQEEMIRFIDRHLRRRKVKQFAKKTLPRLGRAAACFLLVIYIGLTVAVAASQSVRVELMQLILHIEKRYTAFEFESTECYVEVPAEWKGYYYPTFIPNEFTLTKVFTESVIYENHNMEEFVFSEHGSNTVGTIDTEDASIDFIMIGGEPAMITVKGSWTTILWNIDNRCLIVEYSGEKDEAIKIAESVIMIRK